MQSPKTSPNNTIYIIDQQMQIDCRSRNVTNLKGDNTPFKLTGTGFNFLIILCQHAGNVVDYDTLITGINPDSLNAKKSIHALVSRLYNNLCLHFDKSFVKETIKNVRGSGYMLCGTCVSHNPDEPSTAASSFILSNKPAQHTGIPFNFATFYQLTVPDNSPHLYPTETARMLITGKEEYTSDSSFNDYYTDTNIQNLLLGEETLSSDHIDQIVSLGYQVLETRILRLNLYDTEIHRKFISERFNRQILICGTPLLSGLLREAFRAKSDISFFTYMLIYSLRETRTVSPERIKELSQECRWYLNSSIMPL